MYVARSRTSVLLYSLIYAYTPVTGQQAPVMCMLVFRPKLEFVPMMAMAPDAGCAAFACISIQLAGLSMIASVK